MYNKISLIVQNPSFSVRNRRFRGRNPQIRDLYPKKHAFTAKFYPFHQRIHSRILQKGLQICTYFMGLHCFFWNFFLYFCPSWHFFSENTQKYLINNKLINHKRKTGNQNPNYRSYYINWESSNRHPAEC